MHVPTYNCVQKYMHVYVWHMPVRITLLNPTWIFTWNQNETSVKEQTVPKFYNHTLVICKKVIRTHLCIPSYDNLSCLALIFHHTRKFGMYKRFSDAELKVLWNRFRKDPSISQAEATSLAEMLNVSPRKVKEWFYRQCYTRTGVAKRIKKASKGNDYNLIRVVYWILLNPNVLWKYATLCCYMPNCHSKSINI